MCDKGYDLDCLDGIESAPGADSKSACGGAVGPQVIPTHNNNRRAPGQTITTTTSAGSMSWRSENLLTCMLITANVGTIFEESTLLELWFEQLKSYLIKIKPHLVAIHCQEVGGKNYETSMKNVSSFTDKILGDDKVVGDYSRVRIFLDENFECLEKFTALGSLYLVHDSVDNVKLYNFKTAQYDTVEGRRILAAPDKRDLTLEQTTGPERGTDSAQQQQASGSSADVAEHVEKIKFPQELFPECRWSRKGFMRTRWLFNDCQPLDLVNIHLFHDASNLVAMKTTPSPYAQNRQKALEFALREISEPLQVVNNNNNNSSSTNNNNNNNSSNNNNNNNNRGQVSQNLITKSSQPAIQEQQAGDCTATTIEQHEQNQVPMFIFGDFNFRLNTSKVIQRITEGTSPVVKKNANSDEVLEIVYHRKTSDCAREGPVCNECDKQEAAATSNNTNALSSENNGIAGADETGECCEEGGVLMTLGKKLFDYRNLDETFRATKNTEWLLELDNELDSFKRQLYEFKISFKPSYPFKEDHSGGYSYMKTRCPAWCDRILFNETGYRLIKMAGAEAADESGAADMQAAPTNPDSEKRIELLQNQGDVIYRLMGSSVPMGDHKPVLLYCHLNISLKQDQQQQQQQLQSQQNPSSKCNRTVMSASAAASITPPTPIEDNMVESTAM